MILTRQLTRFAPAESVSRAFLARAISLPLYALAGLLAAKVFVDDAGLIAFGIYGLAVSIPQLIPIGDLGLGAGLIEVAGQHRADPGDTLRASVLSAQARLARVGAMIALVSLFLLVPDVHRAVGLHDQRAAGCVVVALIAFAVSMPLTPGARVLVGMSRSDYVPWILLLSPVVTLVGFVGLHLVGGAPAIAYVAVFGLAQVAAGILACRVAGHLVGFSLLRPHHGNSRAGKASPLIKSYALPGFIITSALPIAYTSDRYILQLVSSYENVGIYSAITQLANPCIGLISAAGLALWGRFAVRRTSGVGLDLYELREATLKFLCLGGVVALLLSAAGPWVLWLITGRTPDASGTWTILLFAVLIVLQAIQYPAAMMQMDQDGIRFQAWCSAGVCVVSVVTSYLLARSLGLVGPILGSVIGFTTFLAVPTFVRAVRQARDVVREDGLTSQEEEPA